MEQMRSIVERLDKMTAEQRAKLQTSANAGTSAADRLGDRFTTGTRVLDIATGRSGEIVSSLSEGNTRVYGVRLVDGRMVHRGASEIEEQRSLL
jgi:hypothetical protein